MLDPKIRDYHAPVFALLALTVAAAASLLR